ncbi:MAG: sulfatase [Pseudomonadales bacterium]|jgi:arylsulfatase A-like enzyme|nr:sulfatase [Pseudomonadales bacterium]MDP7594864.1 sulfatase [Pseudomonadales bacterium]HJN51211.1 sulfatase [Pseudomonadales bacterium]
MKPNIVFAFADDWGRYAHVYAKHEGPSSLCELLETPNFDRVAHEGVLLKNALVPAPTCTPCRSSILSGQYFWQTGLGAILVGAVWDETIPTYPMELESKGGYFIGYQYKVWSPGRTANAPIGAKRTRYQPAGYDFNQFSHWVTANAPELGIEAAKNVLYDETRQNFRAFLDARPDEQPFCYWWGPTNTHRTWERGSGKALWGIEPDSLEGRLPEFLPDVHEVREDTADYLGECLAVDYGIGILLEELTATGELDNTLFVVSGDHGIPGMPRAKCNLYDIGCEVALAARWPGKIKAGREVDDFVNLMDLAPTFCDAGGIDIPPSMTAKSIMPLLTSEVSGQVDAARDFVVTGRERHVHIAREGMLPYPQRSLRTKDFLYIINFEPDRWPMGDPKGLDDPATPAPDYEDLAYRTMVAYPDLDASPTKAWMIHHRQEQDVEPLYELAFGKRPREELYDLNEDPDYMNNVAYDPAYANVRQSLEERLLSVLRNQNDPRLMEQPCRYEFEPYAGPLSEDQYPDG